MTDPLALPSSSARPSWGGLIALGLMAAIFIMTVGLLFRYAVDY
jgi:hypothetical protein